MGAIAGETALHGNLYLSIMFIGTYQSEVVHNDIQIANYLISRKDVIGSQ